MKQVEILLSAAFMAVFTLLGAQDAEEIINGYHEVTGGQDAWLAIDGLRYEGKVNQGGMEIPMEMVQMKDGKSYIKASVQGLSFWQNVYDGETLWNTNQMTMKPEKVSTEDLENHLLDLNDFPDALINYKEKGYTAELVGTETFDGTECYKIKLTTEPKMLNGEKKDDVGFYYFDTDSNILLGEESEVTSGPMAGSTQQVTFSDYQEVDGLYFPFSIAQGLKGGPSAAIIINKVEVNPEIDEAMLAFPEGK